MMPDPDPLAKHDPATLADMVDRAYNNPQGDRMPTSDRAASYSNTKAHPVYQLLRHAAHEGRPPAAAELDALRLQPEHRRRVAKAAKEVAAFKAAGENAPARRHADDEADGIINNLLPDEQADADYLRPPEPPGPADPAALAAAVPRGW